MIYFLAFAFFAGGLFILHSEVVGLPPLATAKGIKTAVRSRQTFFDTLLTVVIMPIVKVVSPFIVIADYKEKRMAEKLKRAGIYLTPKEYCARTIVASVLFKNTLKNDKYYIKCI